MKRIEYRRKREGKTDYRNRLELLKSGKARLVIRPSLKNMVVQVFQYDEKGDKVLAAADSKELEKKFGWKANRSNIPSAYLTGYLLGKKAVKAGVKEAILDIGLEKSIKGGKLYSALKGALDAGLKVPCSEDIFPSEDAIKGAHIASYDKKSPKSENITKDFEETKKKIE